MLRTGQKKKRTGRRVRFAIPEEPSKDEEKKELSHVARLIRINKQGARDLFLPNYGMEAPPHEPSTKLCLAVKVSGEYDQVRDLPRLTPQGRAKAAVPPKVGSKSAKAQANGVHANGVSSKKRKQSALDDHAKANTERDAETTLEEMVDSMPSESKSNASSSTALTVRRQVPAEYSVGEGQLALIRRKYPKPQWHAPWKLKTVLSGHLGWVRAVTVDVANEWFATGSNDRTIKIWDLASGTLKLTLTGHINAVTGLCVSPRHTYLYSVADDKLVKCWDLEYNKVIRNYHGHLSGVYGCSLHPTLDVLMTCGRDASVRVWDCRTEKQVHILTGHTHTVAAVKTQASDPQVISGSHDSTVRLWDLRTGRCSAVLTNHKKSVRDIALHPQEFTFASASADNLKVWKFPDGEFMRNLSGAETIVNTLSINYDNILVSGGDEGTLKFWDWKTGYNFQSIRAPPQPGSLDSERGIFASTFDMTGTRLITAEADKSIKIWKEDEDATPQSHPVDYKPPRKRARY